ncbi:MAG: copper homeostasis protein CutC [Verrucomicrobiales bacterium]
MTAPLTNADSPHAPGFSPATPTTPVLEICVDCLASVHVCRESRVPRIELCAGLVEGGTTPSIGFLRQARAGYAGRIMVMIRPRAGDFIVSPPERRAMIDDIHMARDHGADGVVFGCLDPDGTIDRPTAEALVAATGDLDMTFHRAFDVSRDWARSLETLIELGIPRVLTSGGRATVDDGFKTLTALHMQAKGRISLMAGGGLKPASIARLWPHGIREFHLSARRSVDSAMVFRRPDIPMGVSEVPGEYVRRQTDPALLGDLIAQLGLAGA